VAIWGMYVPPYEPLATTSLFLEHQSESDRPLLKCVAPRELGIQAVEFLKKIVYVVGRGTAVVHHGAIRKPSSHRLPNVS
jgi:hypothetical protein